MHPAFDPTATGRPSRSRNLPRWWAALVIAVGAAAFLNGIRGVFLYDDEWLIVESPRVRSIDQVPMGRFLVDLSLYLNYQAGRLDVTGYHLFNIAVHVLAGALLFGLVRRTLRLEPFSQAAGRHADALALVIALIWVSHPLQTQAVTYISQRAESMTGLFYLATLWCLRRTHDGPPPAWRWQVAAVAACAAGMLCKPVMVTAPLVAAIYDRTFLCASWGDLWRRRRILHVALWSTLVIPLLNGTFGLAMGTGERVAASAGADLRSISSLEYALTQPGVILHYLRLSFWPHPLCFDYAWPVARTASAVAGPALALAGLLGLTAWALRRRPRLGFLGASFFLILAPSSSIIPIAHPAFEHRMYLPLAAVVTAVVLAAAHGLERLCRVPGAPARLGRWLPPAVAACAVAVLALLTIDRNRDYQSAERMRRDVLRTQPGNWTAQTNLGRAILESGRPAEAMPRFATALQLNPRLTRAQYNVGETFKALGRPHDAIAAYQRALELDPGDVLTLNNLGVTLLELGRVPESAGHFRRAIERRPAWAVPHFNLGLVHLQQGRPGEARAQFRAALERDPGLDAAREALAIVSGPIASGAGAGAGGGAGGP